MAGLARIWVGALLAKKEQLERAELLHLLTKIEQAAPAKPDLDTRAHPAKYSAAALVMGLGVGLIIRRC
jgi:hypothetical protein